MNWFVLTAAFCFVISSCKAQTSCPSICRCNYRNIVHCNERNFNKIPYGIPETTIVLHLQQNNIRNGPTVNENLSALKRLKRLNLHLNKLTSVPSGLAKTLESVDFSSNRIEFVHELSLKGMSSLEQLYLSENNITNKGLFVQVFKDTQNLLVLDLSKNLLNTFPKNLPKSLRVLRLNKNRINFISFNATKRLKNLTVLDLSENRIIQKTIAHAALFKLTDLFFLDLSRNLLTQVPVWLPPRLEHLLLGSNKLEYIFNEENSQHGSLNSVKTLKNIDLSSNLLKSIELNAFSGLRLTNIKLQENPWQCDCYLRYLKQWVERKKIIVSNEDSIKCSSPLAFVNVSLSIIDEKSLRCIAKPGSSKMIQVLRVNSNEVVLQWKSPFLTPDPAFIIRYLTYGPMKCKKCSLDELLLLSDSFSSRRITSFMESYSSEELSSNQVSINLIIVNKLQSDRRYLFCVSNSQSGDKDVTLKHCLVVKTLPSSVPVAQDNAVFVPLWGIIFFFSVLLFFVVVIIVAVFAKKKNCCSTTPQRFASNLDDIHSSAYLTNFHQQASSKYPISTNKTKLASHHSSSVSPTQYQLHSYNSAGGQRWTLIPRMPTRPTRYSETHV